MIAQLALKYRPKFGLFLKKTVSSIDEVKHLKMKILNFKLTVNIYIYYISGGPLSALTCCVNVRLLSGDKKNIAVNLFSKLGWELGLYYASYDDFHPDILARMYT